MRWRLLLSSPRDGPGNMALDHALMSRARKTGESVFRVYSWDAPVLSLGRNQRAVGVYDDHELGRRGITVVRRPTGGRALLHHREITYSVTSPVSGNEGLTAAYDRINLLLLDALTALGVSAAVAAPVSPSRTPTAVPCFAEPALGEIVVRDRKLVGSAQWRDEGALLQHGSIIVEDDQSLIPFLMRDPASTTPPPATLREELGEVPEPSKVAQALFDAVRAHVDSCATSLLDEDVAALEIASFVAHYRDPSWTWRR